MSILNMGLKIDFHLMKKGVISKKQVNGNLTEDKVKAYAKHCKEEGLDAKPVKSYHDIHDTIKQEAKAVSDSDVRALLDSLGKAAVPAAKSAAKDAE